MPRRRRTVIARDLQQLARACQVLLALVGVEDQSLWSPRGPSRRAIWLKGYLRRAPARADGAWAPGPGALAPIASLTRAERTMLLVAFDFWNGSGGASFNDVVGLAPRLVRAIAGFMEARHIDTDAIEMWIACWSPPKGAV